MFPSWESPRRRGCLFQWCPSTIESLFGIISAEPSGSFSWLGLIPTAATTDYENIKRKLTHSDRHTECGWKKIFSSSQTQNSHRRKSSNQKHRQKKWPNSLPNFSFLTRFVFSLAFVALRQIHKSYCGTCVRNGTLSDTLATSWKHLNRVQGYKTMRKSFTPFMRIFFKGHPSFF